LSVEREKKVEKIEGNRKHEVDSRETNGR